MFALANLTNFALHATIFDILSSSFSFNFITLLATDENSLCLDLRCQGGNFLRLAPFPTLGVGQLGLP